MSIDKIGMYKTDEILKFMTEGEGRNFLGRSMFDAMYFEIERLNNIIYELEKMLEHDKQFHLDLINKKGLSNIEEEKNCSYTLVSYDVCDLYLNKIKELKGDDKE